MTHALPTFLLALALGAPPATEEEFFEKQVRPLLTERCLKCHGEEKPKGGLKLTSCASFLKGGDSGPALMLNNPEQSLLLRAVSYTDDLKMPPKEKLSDRERDILVRWVSRGAVWPKNAPSTEANSSGFQIRPDQKRFWTFQPVCRPALPQVKDADWARTPLDRFILQSLDARQLHPAPAADRRTLLRRVTLDLTGLPPTPEEIAAFVGDQRPDAYARVVDRLLASPAYGQHWGRHWLDLVRYTDSFDARGIGNETDCADAWRYRDWVVDNLNRDLPYDQFVANQVAGDLLPAPGGFNRDGIIATGMLALGNWGGGDSDKDKLLTDIADDQVDVVSRTFLGLTLACARCHDHKFDPLSMADYYGMAGIFMSSHILPTVGPKTNGPPMLRIPLQSPEDKLQQEERRARADQKKQLLQRAQDEAYGKLAVALQEHTADYLLAVHDYEQQPPGPSRLNLATLASRRGLNAPALQRWQAVIGGSGYQLMKTPFLDVQGKKEIKGWRGQAECPNLLVNTSDKAMTVSTLTLPPRSIAVHPGPTNGVAIGFRSPIKGTIKITGKVVDADPNGGDGIAWIIDHRHASGLSQLASGVIANGGKQGFEQGTTPQQLNEVNVAVGDQIELLVLPGDNYNCDTTTVELVIQAREGDRVWDVTRDVLADPIRSNPLPDRQGNAAVWHFWDLAQSPRGKQDAKMLDLVAQWDKARTAFQAGKLDRGTLQKAAQTAARSYRDPSPGSPFWIRGANEETALPAATRADLERLRREIQNLEARPNVMEFANGIQEGGVPGSPHAGLHEIHIHLRGRYDRLGDLTPRRFPEILGGKDQPPITNGSGRLQLARWLTSPDNPLTARVMVNRIWQHHFGEGLVRTPSNFGKLGTAPTHPELLDYLASEFVHNGWSIKALHRTILLSATYRQASVARLETATADPDNQLWGRINRRRLEAESLRDSLLAVAGRLQNDKPGGPSVRDFNDPRRTLYLTTIRSDRSGFAPLFDTADSTAAVERRTVSTIAPQALFLLNHPFVHDQARSLATRLLREEKDTAGRINRLYQLLYGRLPLAAEQKLGEALVQANKGTEQAWQDYCHVLLCANEFVYVD